MTSSQHLDGVPAETPGEPVLVDGVPAVLVQRGLHEGKPSERVRYGDGSTEWLPPGKAREARVNGLAAALARDPERLRALIDEHPAAIVALALVDLGATGKLSDLRPVLTRLIAGPAADAEQASKLLDRWWESPQTRLKQSALLKRSGPGWALMRPKAELSLDAVLAGEREAAAVFAVSSNRTDAPPASTVVAASPAADLATTDGTEADTSELATNAPESSESSSVPAQEPPSPEPVAQAERAEALPPAEQADVERDSATVPPAPAPVVKASAPPSAPPATAPGAEATASAELGAAPEPAAAAGTAPGEARAPDLPQAASVPHTSPPALAILLSNEQPAASSASRRSRVPDSRPQAAAVDLGALAEEIAALERSIAASQQHAARLRRLAGLAPVEPASAATPLPAGTLIERLRLPATEQAQATRALRDAGLAPSAPDAALAAALLERASLHRHLLAEAAAGAPSTALALLTGYLERRHGRDSAAALDGLRQTATDLALGLFTLPAGAGAGLTALAALLAAAEALAQAGEPSGAARSARQAALADIAVAVPQLVPADLELTRLLDLLSPAMCRLVAESLVQRPQRLAGVWAALSALPPSERVELSPLIMELVLQAPNAPALAALLANHAAPSEQQELFARLRHQPRGRFDDLLLRLLLALPEGGAEEATMLAELAEPQLLSPSPPWPLHALKPVLDRVLAIAEEELSATLQEAAAERDAARAAEQAARTALAHAEQDLAQVRGAAQQAVASARLQPLPPAVRELAQQLRESVRLAAGGSAPDQRLELLESRLQAVLARAGVRPADESGAIVPFDPERHEPLQAGLAPGALVRVLHPGYVAAGAGEDGGQRLLVPALVAAADRSEAHTHSRSADERRDYAGEGHVPSR